MKKQEVKVADDFQFEVGATYENMKGIFEVISIQRDTMVIRWKNGNEVATTVDVQKRILERKAYEEQLQEQENIKSQEKVKKPKRKTSAGAAKEE